VPVGKDQKQHLEVTRDLAVKINEALGDAVLTIPDVLIKEESAIVPGLDGQKMSKSYNNTIPLFGEEKPLRKTFMKIVSDSTAVEDPKPTENSTILALYKLFASETEYQAMVESFQSGGLGYGHYKQQLWEAYWNYFAPMRQRREEILADPGYVNEVLRQGAKKARATASHVLDRIRRATGLSV
jgi:tryptophanyl-tRNA synthetase